jgi:hypothetical protein
MRTGVGEGGSQPYWSQTSKICVPKQLGMMNVSEVLAHRAASVQLHGPVDDLQCHGGGRNLDHRDLLLRRLVPCFVRLPCGIQHQPPRLVDQDPGLCDARAT